MKHTIKSQPPAPRSGVITAAQQRRSGRMRHRADRRPKDARRVRAEHASW
jgi:hypothetical protein